MGRVDARSGKYYAHLPIATFIHVSPIHPIFTPSQPARRVGQERRRQRSNHLELEKSGYIIGNIRRNTTLGRLALQHLVGGTDQLPTRVAASPRRICAACVRHIHHTRSVYAQVAREHQSEAWNIPPPAPVSPSRTPSQRVDPSREDDHAVSVDEAEVAFAAFESARLSSSSSRSQTAGWDDYVPDDSDFQVEPDLSAQDIESAYALDPPQTQATRRAGKVRRGAVPYLPPLPFDKALGDGESRFDWRQRSLSQVRKAQRGMRWFPEHHFERVQPEKEKLTWGDAFHDELERYKTHFIPLLQAELREEQRLFQARLEEWSLPKLRREGFAIPGLLGARAKWQAKQGGTVYEFRKDGQRDVSLPFHKFTSGSAVILSRTDPLLDAVLEDGSLGPVSETTSFAQAKVYSLGRHFLRIQVDLPVEDIAEGTWRLDVGLSSWATQTQINAIQALNDDPVLQDARDIQQRSLATRSMAAARPAKSGGRKKPKVEQTILSGTALRDKVLRAFQKDFVPYESTTSLSVTPSNVQAQSPAPLDHVPLHEDGIEIVNDGIVAPQRALKAEDVDAKPVVAHTEELSGTLVRNELIRNWAIRHRAEGDVVRSDGDPHVPLNPSQLRAIAMMLSERLSLVQGPPGTGKTRVIIETIKLLKKHWQIPHPILVTAHTNVAVDNLVGGLRSHGLKAVRLGAMERVRPDLQDWSFDIVSQSHPLAPEVEMLQTEIDDLWRRDVAGNWVFSSEQRRERSKDLRNRLHGLRAAMFTDVLLDADVICTTCLSAASSYILKNIDFPMVFLDEASMATEPLSLVPLMKGSSHVAIIGDHKQLPPVIISDAAKAGGLATSLFERLIHERHVPSIMLDTQYRMHPAISAFPSLTFYNSDLKDGTVKPDGSVVAGFEVPSTGYLEDVNGKPTSMTFIDHDHPESPEMRSIANHGDAEIIGDIVVDLLLNNPDLRGSDIGVIAPYAAQIRAIDKKLNGDPIILDAMADVLGSDRASEIQEIEIKTVDGFEGREKQVIIFSTVRSNHAGYIGFLADWRRLNVGVTRAKRGLIMVGSAQTLEKAQVDRRSEESLPAGGPKVWRDFMAHLRSHGLVIKHSGHEA